MAKMGPLSSASRFAVRSIVIALGAILLFMVACSSGNVSSDASGSTSASASEASDALDGAVSGSSDQDASQNNRALYGSEFVGTWELVDMERNGERISELNPSAVPYMREQEFLNIIQDGFLDIVVEDKVYQGIWEASSPTEGSVMLSADISLPIVIVDGVLTLGPDGDDTISYFARGESRETPPLAEGQHDLRDILGG